MKTSFSNCIRRLTALLMLLAAAASCMLPLSGICEPLQKDDPIEEELELSSGSPESFFYASRGGRSIGHMNQTDRMDFSTIRVLLSLSYKNTVKLRQIQMKLHGEYYFAEDGRCLRDDSDSRATLTIKSESGVINAYNAAGELITSGTTLSLNRVYVSHTAGYATLFTTSGSEATSTYCTNGFSYLGNFVFSCDAQGYLKVVNSLPLAHYIYGVVGYEMNYSKPREALRAQAVAAKCFGMCFMSGEPGFDVQDGYDNYTYQRYHGYSLDANVQTTMERCLSVIGIALSYQGRVIPTFFGASNGGETTIPSVPFTHSIYDDAYDIVLDPVDWAVSPRHEELTVTFGQQSSTDKTVRRFWDFILSKANEELGASYDRVVSISSLYCYQPYSTAQHDMRMIYVNAVLADAEGGELAYELRFEAKELKERTLTDIDGSGENYSEEPCVFNKNFKTFWGESIGSGYTVHFCRHGNGVGLSQHGAAAMALPEYGSKTCEQILAFYYPHFDLISITERDPEAPLLSTLPVKAYGRCTANYIGLRSEPSYSQDALMEVLMKDEHVDIVSVTENGQFYQVLCRGHMGYVSASCVRIDMFPAPADAQFTVYSAVSGTGVLLRTAPTQSANAAAVLTDAKLTLWTSIGDWYYATTDNAAGFIRAADVTITDEYIYDGADIIVNKAPAPRSITSLKGDGRRPAAFVERG